MVWKVIGILILGIGGVGEIYEWIARNKSRQKRLEELIIFLKKSRYAMEEEKVRWIPFFQTYESEDELVNETLRQVGDYLEQHRYPYGEEAWKSVFLERKNEWNCKESCFQVFMQMGGAFFGRSKQENGAFMERSIRQLEECKQKEIERFAEEKKVWIPVSMLGGVLLVILLL